MREVWFGAVPEFVRRSNDCCCWAAIFEIDDCIRDFHPKSFVEFCFCNDSLDSFHNRSICPFCNAVLVGAVRSCCLVNNAGSLEMCSHPFFVFSTSVGSQPLDLLSSLLFHFRLVLPEFLQHVCRRFLLEGIDVSHPCEIVGKKEVVVGSAVTCWVDWTTEVAVDKLE